MTKRKIILPTRTRRCLAKIKAERAEAKRLLKTAKKRWCFVHGPSRAWNDRRHQVVLIRCVRVGGRWWRMVGKQARPMGRASPSRSEAGARRTAVRHAEQHLRSIKRYRKSLAQEEKQVQRDIVRFA